MLSTSLVLLVSFLNWVISVDILLLFDRNWQICVSLYRKWCDIPRSTYNTTNWICGEQVEWAGAKSGLDVPLRSGEETPHPFNGPLSGSGVPLQDGEGLWGAVLPNRKRAHAREGTSLRSDWWADHPLESCRRKGTRSRFCPDPHKLVLI